MSFELSDVVAEFVLEVNRAKITFEKNLNDYSFRYKVNLLSFDGETKPILPPWFLDRVLRSMISRRGEEKNWRSIEINLKNKLFDSKLLYLCQPKRFIHLNRNMIRELVN